MCILGCCWTFLHRPTNSPAACTHMHTQPGMSDLREVLHDRENWVGDQASRLRPAEETGEEEEKVS